MDTSEFEAIPRQRSGGTCSFRRLGLSSEDRAVLNTILFDRPDITAKAIVKVLAQHDIRISRSTVERHRRRDCLCDAK